MRSPSIDQDLVLRARTGDLQAFATLVDARLDRLFAVARLIVQDDTGAEEAVKSGLLLAWRDLPGLRDPASFDPWLHRLLVRACDRAASRQRGSTTEVADGSSEVERGFRALSPELRAALVIRYVPGRSLAESAAVLDVPVGIVQSRVSRASASLRAALDADDGAAGSADQATA